MFKYSISKYHVVTYFGEEENLKVETDSVPET